MFSLNVDANRTVHVKGKLAETIDSGQEVMVSSGYKVTISAGAVSTISGGLRGQSLVRSNKAQQT